VFKILGLIVSVASVVVMTAMMASAIYANRSALPVVGVVFAGLIAFGLFVEV
jgi:hypothetical protein